jgi:four helix bundle protein
MIKSLADLDVYNISYILAVDMFNLTRSFPKEERYSLTDQLVRASRSVAANIAEGWGKRVYENEFKRHLVYAMGSLEETKVWLRFSKDCRYINDSQFEQFGARLNECGSKLFKLYTNWKQF